MAVSHTKHKFLRAILIKCQYPLSTSTFHPAVTFVNRNRERNAEIKCILVLLKMSISIYCREVDDCEFLVKIHEITSMDADIAVKISVFEDEICFGLDERWATDDRKVFYLSEGYNFADIYERSHRKINRVARSACKDFVVKVLPGLFFGRFEIDQNFDSGIRKLDLDGWVATCEVLYTIDTAALKAIDFASQNGIHFQWPHGKSRVTIEEVRFLEYYLRKWVNVVEVARSAGKGLFVYCV